MTTFTTLAPALAFLRGFCVDRVVARMPSGGYAVVHPRTAKRNGWKVVHCA